MLIQGLKDVYRIENYSLHKEANQHSQLEFSALMAVPNSYTSQKLLGQPVQAFLEAEGKTAVPSLVFQGIITSVRMEQSYHEMRLHIRAASASVLLDRKPHWHLFQADDKKFQDILEMTTKDFPKTVLFQADEEVNKQTVTEIVVQDGETAFAFLCRCAKVANIPLWVVDNHSGLTGIYLRQQMQSRPKEIPEAWIRCLTAETDWQNQSLHLELTHYVELGSLVTISNHAKIYLVTALTVIKEHGRDIYRYNVEEYQQKKVTRIHFDDDRAYRLSASVLNNQDPKHMGRIQLKYNAVPWQVMDEEKPRWISYRSPYVGKQGGIVFLPDEGEPVEVTILHGDAYTATSYRSLPLEKENGNVKDKYIGNNYRRRILWKKDALELLSGDNKIVLTDKEIDLIVGKSRLHLDGQKIILQNESNQLVMDGNLQILSKGTTTVAGERETTVQSKGNTVIDGAQVALQSQGSVKAVAQQKMQLQGKGIDIKSNGVLNLAGTTVNLC